MAFSFSSQFSLNGPVNMAQVRRTIQAGLSGISVPVGVTTNGTRNLGALNSSLVQTRKNMMASTKQLSSFNQAIVEHGQNLGTAARRYATFMAGAAGFFLLFKQLGKAQKDFIDFQNSLVRLAQITGGTVESVKAIGDEVDRLATKYGIASSKLLGVADTLAQAGLTAKDTKVALEALAQTELAPTFDDINNTVQGGIAAMSQFGYAAKDLKAIFGQINQVSAKFAVESKDIVTAVRISGGAFQAAGGDLQELMALFTSVRATTRESAESIATGFRTIFTRLQRKDTLIFLDNLGIKLTDMEGKFVGPYNAIRELSGALAGLDKTDPRFSQIIEELGGYRQISKVIPLITKFGSTAESALGVARAGSNSLEATTTKSAESISRQLEMLGERFNKLYRDIAQSKGMQAFGRLLLYIANTAITVADAMKDLIGTVLSLYAVFSLLRLSSVGKGFISGFAGGKPKRMASGGKADDANSLLMPGEIVIGKREAQKIGYGKLDALNRGVAKVPGVGNTDSVPAYLEEGSYVLKKSIAKKMGLEGFARGGRKGGLKGMATGGHFSDDELVNPPPNTHPVVIQQNRRESRRQEKQKLQVMGISDLTKRITELTSEIQALETEIKANGVENVDLGKLEDSRMKRQMASRQKANLTSQEERNRGRQISASDADRDKRFLDKERSKVGVTDTETLQKKLQEAQSKRQEFSQALKMGDKEKIGKEPVNVRNLKKYQAQEAIIAKELQKRAKQDAATSKKNSAKTEKIKLTGAKESARLEVKNKLSSVGSMTDRDLQDNMAGNQGKSKDIIKAMSEGKTKTDGGHKASLGELRKAQALEEGYAREIQKRNKMQSDGVKMLASDKKKADAKTDKIKDTGAKESIRANTNRAIQRTKNPKMTEMTLKQMSSGAKQQEQEIIAAMSRGEDKTSSGQAANMVSLRRQQKIATAADKALKQREQWESQERKKLSSEKKAAQKKQDAKESKIKAMGAKEAAKEAVKQQEENFKSMSVKDIRQQIDFSRSQQKSLVQSMQSGQATDDDKIELMKERKIEEAALKTLADRDKANAKLDEQRNKAMAAAKQKAIDAMIKFAGELDGMDFRELQNQGDVLEAKIQSQAASGGKVSKRDKDKLKMIRSSQAAAAGLDENGNIKSKGLDRKAAISDMANRRAEVAQSQYHSGKISSKELADANENAKKASEDLQKAIRSETEARINSLKAMENDTKFSSEERDVISQRRQELELARDENEARISSEGALGGFGMSGNKAMTLVTENFALIAAAVAGAMTAWISANTHIQRMSEVTASLNGEMTAQQETIAKETAARESTISGLTTFAALMGGVAYALKTDVGARIASKAGGAALYLVPALGKLGMAAGALGAGLIALVAIVGIAAYAWIDSARQYQMEMGAQLEEARKANVGSLVSQISQDLGMLNQEFVNSAQDISNVSAKFSKAFELINANTDAKQQAARKENSTTWDSISTNIFGESDEYKARMDNFVKEGIKQENSSLISSADPLNDALVKQMNGRITKMVDGMGVGVDEAIRMAMSEVGYSEFSKKLEVARKASGNVAETSQKIVVATQKQLKKQAELTAATKAAREETDRSTNTIRRYNTLMTSVEMVSAAMDDLTGIVDVYGSVLGGGGGLSSAVSPMRGLETADTLDFETYNKTATKIGSYFGEAGQQAAKEAIMVNNLPSMMETILNDVKARGFQQDDAKFGEEIRNAIREREKSGQLGNSNASSIVSTRLRALGDAEISGKIVNIKAFVEELVEGLGDSQKILERMNQSIADNLNRVGKMYKAFKDADSAFKERKSAMVDRNEDMLSLRRKIFNPDVQGVRGDEARPNENVGKQMEALAGTRNVFDINNRLNKNFNRLEGLANTPRDQYNEAIIKEIEDLNADNNNLVKALELASDASKRLSGIMERLASIEAEKTNRGDINAEIATGGMKAVRQIAMEDQAARMAIARGGLREDIADPRAAKENEMALSGLNRMKDIEANQAVPQKFLGKFGFGDKEIVKFGQIADKMKQNFQAKLPGQVNRENEANAIGQRRGLQDVKNQKDILGMKPITEEQAMIRNAEALEFKRTTEIKNRNNMLNKRKKGEEMNISQVVQRMTKEEMKAAGIKTQKLESNQRFETDTEKALRMDAERLRGLAGGARIKNDVGDAKAAEEARLKAEAQKIMDDSNNAANAITAGMEKASQTFFQQLLANQQWFLAKMEESFRKDIDNETNQALSPLYGQRADLIGRNAQIEAGRVKMSQTGGGLNKDEVDYAMTEGGFDKIQRLAKSQKSISDFTKLDIPELTNKNIFLKKGRQEFIDNVKEQLGKLGESGKPILDKFMFDMANGTTSDARKKLMSNISTASNDEMTRAGQLQKDIAATSGGKFNTNKIRTMDMEKFDEARKNVKGLGSTQENNAAIAKLEEQIKFLEAERAKRKGMVPQAVEAQINGNNANAGQAPGKKDVGQKASDLNGMFTGLLGGFTTFIKSFDSTTAALTKSLDMLQGAKIEIAGTTKVDINLTGGEALLKIGEAVRKEVMVAVGEKLKQSFPGNSGQIAANFPSGNTNSGSQGSGAVA